LAYYEHLGGNKYRLITRDPSVIGRRRRVSKTVIVPPDIMRSKRRTENWLIIEAAKFEEAVENGEFVKIEGMTFEQFVPQWRKGYALENLGGNTRGHYMSVIKTHLMPEFGKVRLDQIKTLHLVTFFAGLKRKDGKPMATNTKLNVYKAAKSIFDRAHDWKMIATNPMDGVQRPRADRQEKKEIRAQKKNFTTEEAVAVMKAMDTLPAQWRMYFMGAMISGLRRGEMLAIEWKDVDFEKGAIYVESQITLTEEGKKKEGELKTEESEGWIAMPSWYMDELKRYELHWKKEKMRCIDWKGKDKEYLFHSGEGEMYFPSTPTATWRKFLKRNNIPHVKLHGLRHTAGMLLRESGADMKTIQERLRHTKLSTTMDIYTHESEEISRAAANKLEALNPKTS